MDAEPVGRIPPQFDAWVAAQALPGLPDHGLGQSQLDPLGVDEIDYLLTVEPEARRLSSSEKVEGPSLSPPIL